MPTDGDTIVGATSQNSSPNPSNDIFDAKRCDSRNLRLEFQRCQGRMDDHDNKIDIVFGSEVLSHELPAIVIEIWPIIKEMCFKLTESA